LDFKLKRMKQKIGRASQMPNETVHATLVQVLHRYAAQRGQILGKIQNCRMLLSDAEINLKRAQGAERKAVYDDDQLTLKMRELTAYYNSLPEPRPQAILEQNAELGREQLQTHRKRMASHDVVREQLRTVEEARRELAMAEQEEATISQRIRETNTEIERTR
jgi:hypothetical protein